MDFEDFGRRIVREGEGAQHDLRARAAREGAQQSVGAASDEALRRVAPSPAEQPERAREDLWEVDGKSWRKIGR